MPQRAHQNGDVVLTEGARVQNDAFEAVADPKFCYLDPLRKYASARFLSGLHEGEGLFTLTGQIGIGKTTLLRHVAGQLTALDGVLLLCPTHVLACRTGATLADVLGACEGKLGLGELGAAPLKAAKRLQQLAEGNRSPVLLLDEADLLGDDLLEAFVTLTRLRAAERRILSIVLAGHPSIPRRISTITGNDDVLGAGRAVELEPMAEPCVARLIRHRLRTAGRPEDAFDPDAIAQIARHSAGVPGAVVEVCRRAIQIVENWSRKTVTADIVAEAIAEKISGVQRESSRPELIGSAPKPNIAPDGRPEASQASISATAPSRAEFRPVRPLVLRDMAPAPEPSLAGEHVSIREATPEHHLLSTGPGERTTRSYQPMRYPRGRNRRVKLMLACAGGVLLVLLALAAGLVVLYDNPHKLAHRARTSAIDGPVGNVGASPAYDGGEDPDWRQHAAPPEPVAPGAGSEAYTLNVDVAPQAPLPPQPPSTKDTTKGAPETPPAEAATILEKLGRPARPIARPPFASLAPAAADSESASDKVERMQLTARMQGLEPGQPIDLPIRLSKGQARTIYFFTELRGLSGRTVLHRWEWNGRVMQERQLHPASQAWNAFTGMAITDNMQGSWRVSAIDATTGKILAEQHFEVQ